MDTSTQLDGETMPSLTQRWAFTKWTLQVTETGVSFRESFLTARTSYTVPFENMVATPIRTVESRTWLLVTTVVLVGLTIITFIYSIIDGDVEGPVFWGFFTLLCFGSYLTTRRSIIVYPGAPPQLRLMQGSPSVEQVEEFVSKMKECRRLYLRESYLAPSDAESVADEIDKLDMLRERGVISDSDFQTLKRNLVSPGSSRPPIGFSME